MHHRQCCASAKQWSKRSGMGMLPCGSKCVLLLFCVFCCGCFSLRFFPALMSFNLTPLSIPPQPHTRASSICHKLSEAFGKSRALLRDVGVAANVPIEPELQTKLIDATMQVWGFGFRVSGFGVWVSGFGFRGLIF